MPRAQSPLPPRKRPWRTEASRALSSPEPARTVSTDRAGATQVGTTEAITGAEWLARTLAANGTTHVFFIDAVLRRTLIELGALGVTRVLAHAEKSAAYMADGYARIAGRPGICFA